MKLACRPCTFNEVHQWAEFLNKNFGYTSPLNYAVDFAPWFEPRALEWTRLTWDQNQVVASASLYPVTVKTRTSTLNLGIIGAVATDSLYRGQGLSSSIFKELEECAKKLNLQGLVLWSDQEDFYGKLGFKKQGKQRLLFLKGLPPPSNFAQGTALYGWDWEEVQKIYNIHSLRCLRTNEYWQDLKKIKSCTQVQWVDSTGKLQAYIGFDRGKDMVGVVHEWGGEPHALYSLLWVVLQNRPNLAWLTHPLLKDPIAELLPSKDSLGEFCSPLAWFKFLDQDLEAHADEIWFWGLDSL